MIVIVSENLLNQGYNKIDNFTYEKINKKTGMKVVLKFNKNGSAKEDRKIDKEIINIITRQDI